MRKERILFLRCLLGSWILLGLAPPVEAVTYPQLALGEGYEAVILIGNQTDQEWQGTGQLLQRAGQPWAMAWEIAGAEASGNSSFEIKLPSRSTAKLVLSGTSQLQVGYLKILPGEGFSRRGVNVSFFYNLVAGGHLLESTGVPGGQAARRFAFGVEKSPMVNTGLAWAPYERLSGFPVSASLLDESGKQIQQQSLLFEGHLSRFFSEIFENVPENFLGTVVIDAQEPILLVVLRVETAPAGFQLTSLPPQLLPELDPIVFAGGVRDVGSELQLFLDDWLIDSLSNVRTVQHTPVPREVAIRKDRPYEDEVLYDPTVIKDGHRYRMWYRTNFLVPPFYTGYAESVDGIHWTKPDLGLIQYEGSSSNNIVWPVPGGRGHVLSIFKDGNLGVPADELYKAIGIGSETVSGRSRSVFYGMVSADGLRWRHVQQDAIVRAPLDDPAFDSHNIVIWDEARKHYAIYARGWGRHGVRDIRRFTSSDFLVWSGPTYLDFGSAPVEHLYKNAATPYYRRPDLILMFPKRFQPTRRFPDLDWPHPGLSDVVFMFSRDGLRFDRRYLEAILRPGTDLRNWHERAIEIGPTLVPTGGAEMSVYFVEYYRTPDIHIRRGALRVDGFVSLKAPHTGGTVRTQPLRFSGSRLVINYATSAAGSVKVEFQNSSGEAMPGFALEDCPPIFGDEIDRVVSWEKGSDLGELAGQTIRVRFEMKDADLYSLRFE